MDATPDPTIIPYITSGCNNDTMQHDSQLQFVKLETCLEVSGLVVQIEYTKKYVFHLELMICKLLQLQSICTDVSGCPRHIVA